MPLSIDNSEYHVNDYREDEAHNNGCREREIKAYFVVPDAHIPRKLTQEGDFAPEDENEPEKDHEDAHENKDPADTIHTITRL